MAAVVCSELEQPRGDSAESSELSLVRRGEMTPFGTVVNNAVEVNICMLHMFICIVHDINGHSILKTGWPVGLFYQVLVINSKAQGEKAYAGPILH